jgi:hypothetical protein
LRPSVGRQKDGKLPVLRNTQGCSQPAQVSKLTLELLESLRSEDLVLQIDQERPALENGYVYDRLCPCEFGAHLIPCEGLGRQVQLEELRECLHEQGALPVPRLGIQQPGEHATVADLVRRHLEQVKHIEVNPAAPHPPVCGLKRGQKVRHLSQVLLTPGRLQGANVSEKLLHAFKSWCHRHLCFTFLKLNQATGDDGHLLPRVIFEIRPWDI